MNPADNNSTLNPGTGASGGFNPPSTGDTGGQNDFSGGASLGGVSSDAMGMGGSAGAATNDNSAMTMDAPEDPTPFVPASPAPGSIGSVTSGPAVSSTNLAAAVAPSGADGSAMFAPVSETNPTMPPVGGNDLVAQAANETPATATDYNPFAPASAPATDANTAPASTNPTAPVATGAAIMPNVGAAPSMQGPVTPAANANPAPSPFQARMDNLAKAPKSGGQGSNLLTIIFAVVGVVAIIAAIVFCVLWQQAVNNPQIRYVTTPTTGEESSANVLTCSRMQGADVATGIDNLLNVESTLTLDFANDEWQKSGIFSVYNFVDAGAAQTAYDNIFTAMIASQSLSNGNGDVVVSVSAQPLEDRVEYREDIDMNLMDSATAAARGDIPLAEDGAILKNKEAVQAYYESQGWACK